MNDAPDLKLILLLGNYSALVAVIVVFVILTFGGASMSGEIIAFLSIITGALLANLKEAFSFVFGSSESSQKKDTVITALAATAQAVQIATEKDKTTATTNGESHETPTYTLGPDGDPSAR